MNDKPLWIDATERQPPDAEERPVCAGGWGWGLGRYVNGKWRRNIQRGDIAINVTHWMEVYPLPSTRSPAAISDSRETITIYKSAWDELRRQNAEMAATIDRLTEERR